MSKLDNAIDNSRNYVNKVYTYASNNRERIAKTIVNGLLIIIIFTIFGCFDFVNMRFDFQNLTKVSFWTSTLTKAVAGSICAYNLSVNLFWDRDIDRNVSLHENARKYDTQLKLKDDKTFNHFVINIYNKNEKIKAWVNKINAKIWWLDLFSKKKDKILFANEDTALSEKKSKNKYCIKRAELELLKSEEYIKTNLDNIKVRYVVVNPLSFNKGLDDKPIRLQGTKTVASVGKTRASKTSTGILSMLMVSALITSIAIAPDQQVFASQMERFWHYLLHIGADIGTIGWQLIRGMFDTPKIINEALVDPLVGRNKVLSEYINWCVDNNIETSKAKILMDRIDEELSKQKSEV